MSSTLEVGQQLVDLCRAGHFDRAVEELYASDIESIEAMPGENQRVQGLDAVRAKGVWWEENHEVHSATVDGPYPHGDEFIVFYELDITYKPEGRRFTMKEGALYTVANGKIVREKFYYTA